MEVGRRQLHHERQLTGSPLIAIDFPDLAITNDRRLPLIRSVFYVPEPGRSAHNNEWAQRDTNPDADTPKSRQVPCA